MDSAKEAERDWADEEGKRIVQDLWHHPSYEIFAKALRKADAAAEKRGRIAGLREAAEIANRRNMSFDAVNSTAHEILQHADKLEQSP
jgi:hypothetical protein